VKRANRLRASRDFQRVRREGTSLRHALLVLTVAPSRRTKPARCGIVVSRKLVGHAAQRNRAKRRVREAVRLILPQLEDGVDLIFTVRTAAVGQVPFTTLQTAIETLLRRAQVWVPEPKEQASGLACLMLE
jgi:ribonuclease P protein component